MQDYITSNHSNDLDIRDMRALEVLQDPSVAVDLHASTDNLLQDKINKPQPDKTTPT